MALWAAIPNLTPLTDPLEVILVFCDAWDSRSFREEHREELSADGVGFVFMLVGVPENILAPLPVGLEGSPK